MLPVIVFLCAFLFLTECNAPKNSEPKEIKSSKTVEGLSGITTIKQGEYLKSKIKELEKKENERARETEQGE